MLKKKLNIVFMSKPYFIQKRKAIALFFTLMAIIAITAIVGLTFSYMEKAKDKASRSRDIVQLDVYLKEISDIFKTYAKSDRIMKDNFLSSIYTNFSYRDAHHKDVTMNLKCTPLKSRVNISWLASNDPVKREVANKVFDFMMTQNDINNAYLLKEKLLSYIGDEYTEQKKRHFIVDYKELDDLYTDFAIAISEDKIHINWKDYFSAGINNQTLEKKYLSPEIIASLSNLSLDVIKNEWSLGSDPLKLVRLLGGDESNLKEKIFNDESSLDMACKVRYGKSFKEISFFYLKDRISYVSI
jgi:hypothetical protein